MSSSPFLTRSAATGSRGEQDYELGHLDTHGKALSTRDANSNLEDGLGASAAITSTLNRCKRFFASTKQALTAVLQVVFSMDLLDSIQRHVRSLRADFPVAIRKRSRSRVSQFTSTCGRYLRSHIPKSSATRGLRSCGFETRSTFKKLSSKISRILRECPEIGIILAISFAVIPCSLLLCYFGWFPEVVVDWTHNHLFIVWTGYAIACVLGCMLLWYRIEVWLDDDSDN